MFKPEDLPPQLPEEVKPLLAALKPEPPALLERRQRLLSVLDVQIASAKGTLQELLSATRAVFQAMEPQVPFQGRLAEDFSRALSRYALEQATTKTLPPVLIECMAYLRERVESMGVGPLMETAEATAQAQPQSKGKGKRKRG